jgi:hypothetical protein
MMILLNLKRGMAYSDGQDSEDVPEISLPDQQPAKSLPPASLREASTNNHQSCFIAGHVKSFEREPALLLKC